MMSNKYICSFIDIAGKLMLIWFVFSTIRYFYYGSFSEELSIIPRMFNEGLFFWFIYDLFKVPIAAIGIFIIIPLLLKGNVWGLVLGLLHFVMGNPTNPLWFVVPNQLQVGPEGKPTSLLWAMNISYGIVTLLILVTFYFYRRSIRLENT